MVANSRAALGTYTLRPLNTARPIEVRAQPDGSPLAVRRPAWERALSVAAILDSWRIDDEWWRERRISRVYYALLLQDGRRLTAYHDLVEGRWLEQQDSNPAPAQAQQRAPVQDRA